MLILAELRKQRLLDIDFISRLTGLTPAEYKIYENDKSGCLLKRHPDLIYKLKKILGVETKDLFQNEITDPEYNQLIQKYHKSISDKDIRCIKKLFVLQKLI